MTAPIPVDYTSRDYEAIRTDLIARMATAFPEWNYTGAADFGVLLLELWAHVGDVLHFYIDRAMFEGFVQTAVMRSSMLNLAGMFGYKPNARAAASCTVQVTIASTSVATTIPALTPLLTASVTSGDAPIYFETQSPLTIAALSTSGTVSAIEGRTIKQEALGNATGLAFQDFALYYAKVVGGSALIEVSETQDSTGAPVWASWGETPRFGNAGANDHVYTTYVDESAITHIVFGDNVYGRIPAVGASIRATYRTGIGAAGNIGVGVINTMGVAIPGVLSVTNTTAATGGTDDETIESLRRTIPSSMRTVERCVSLADYYALAIQVPGVQKASITSANHANVTAYVAPAGGGAPNAALLTMVGAYLTDRSMVGTAVTVFGPTYVGVNISVDLYVLAPYVQSKVQAAVVQSLTNLLTFANVDFGSGLSVGAVYRAIYNTEGVDHANITVLSKTGTGVADITANTWELLQVGTAPSVVVNVASKGIIG